MATISSWRRLPSNNRWRSDEGVRGKDREKDREYEQLGKDREKGSERSRDKDRDKGRDREKHREKVRVRDRERGKDREREREKDWEWEKERLDDGETERGRDMEKYDKSRTRDKDRDASWEKGGEEYERLKVDGGDAKIARNDGKEADAHACNQEKPLGSQSTSELEERLIKMKQEKLKRKADDASETLSWGYHEVAVGKGLSGALKLLKDRGTLKESINDNDGPKALKEAFRIISHKFHGKGPGKMKHEKRMKQKANLRSKKWFCYIGERSSREFDTYAWGDKKLQFLRTSFP